MLTISMLKGISIVSMAEQKTIWSFCGCKGGRVKSLAAANIACGLARTGARVLLIDADRSCPGLHAYFGIERPSMVFDDFLKGRAAGLADVSVETGVEGLRLISGGAGFLSMADPDSPVRKRLLKQAWDLDVLHIIVDLGVDLKQGVSSGVLDFFSLSDEGIIVLAPDPVSVQGGFDLLRGVVYRRLERLFSDNFAISALISEATDARGDNPVKTFSDLCERISAVDMEGAQKAISEIKRFRPRVLLETAGPLEDAKAADALVSASKRFLSLEAESIGTIYSGPEAGAGRARLFMLDSGATDERRDLEAVLARIIGDRQGDRQGETGEGHGVRHEEQSAVAPAVSGAVAGSQVQEIFGFNDNVYHQDSVMHVQTEVQGGDDPLIETIAYHGGRIFFSKKTLWSSVGPDAVSAGVKDFAQRQHRAAMAAIKLNKISFKG